MTDLSGQSFGRYHLIEKLGEGGMAVVYKAFDTRLECDVAVKVIRLDNLPRSKEEITLKRFEREAKAVAQLTHPNIVKVTDFGNNQGIPYLVMEYLPGGTLKDHIRQKGQMEWQEAAQLILPIADALGYAHSMKVLHRDVKPGNILLTQTLQPMLTDFGIAKLLDDETTQELTATGATVGTPEYMAPEQVTSKNVDARADIYSLGVVFYELITGRRPFVADTPMAVLLKQASEPLPLPRKLISSLPEKVEEFIIKAMVKDPDYRFQKMAEFSSSLAKLLDNPVAPQTKTSPPCPPLHENEIKQNPSGADAESISPLNISLLNENARLENFRTTLEENNAGNDPLPHVPPLPQTPPPMIPPISHPKYISYSQYKKKMSPVAIVFIVMLCILMLFVFPILILWASQY